MMNAMWFKTIFKTKQQATQQALFDEAFMRRLEQLHFMAQRTLRGNPLSGEHRSRHQVPTSIASNHRPYTVGDDYRYVDWNSYAHQDQMYVKLGEVEQDVYVHILFDISRSMEWGTPSKLRVTQQLVAALGYIALAHSDRLFVSPFHQNVQRGLGPLQGKDRMVELLRFLEPIQASQRTSLSSALQNYTRLHQRGGILVLISDLLDTAGLDAALRAVANPRWQVLLLHLVDETELTPKIQGDLELEDAETGQRMRLQVNEETVREYRQHVNNWLTEINAVCSRRNIHYAHILSQWDLAQMVMPYLQLRQVLR
jgi:uncharacterized protein (DUF58 family)